MNDDKSPANEERGVGRGRATSNFHPFVLIQTLVVAALAER